MDEIEEKEFTDRIKDEENQARIESEAVNYTVHTEGWKVLSKKLKEEEKAQQDLLLTIPMLPENLGSLALAQAHVKGIKFIFDMIEDLKNKNQIG